MNLYSTVCVLLATVIINSSDARNINSSARKPAAIIPQTTVTVKTTMNSSWTWANPIFKHDDNSFSSYYDVIEIKTSSGGDYTFSTKSSVGTYGYLYRPPFDPADYEHNLLESGYGWESNSQFEFSYYLDRSVTYYLVVTTSRFLTIGKYQLLVTGATTVTLSRITVLEPSMPNITFESMFTNLQPHLDSYCQESSYYPYDIFSIVLQENGNYTIETVSDDGTNIRLYSPSFNPLTIVFHMEAMDETDEYYSRQQLQVNLLASNQYYLIVSKFDYYIDAEERNYRLTFRGPSQFTMTKLTDTFVSTIQTSSSVTKTSPRFTQDESGNPTYYFKVFHITVRQLGIHTLLVYSRLDLTGYLYQHSFSPRLFYRNQIADYDDFDPQAEFGIKEKLITDTDYYFVVSTYAQKVTGAFNITGAGPQPFNISAVPDNLNSTETLSSSLTSSSRRFVRCQAYSGAYYYRLFNISVPSLGLYTIKTVGSMDTFGCLYRNSFNPNKPESDLFSFDDQGGGSDQFAITTVLKSNTVYYLAVSTKRVNRLGSFTLSLSGPVKMTIRSVDSA